MPTQIKTMMYYALIKEMISGFDEFETAEPIL